MSLELNSLQRTHLEPLKHFQTEDVINLCKLAFEYLTKGSGDLQSVYEHFVKRYQETQKEKPAFGIENVQQLINVLILLLVNVTRTNLTSEKLQGALEEIGFNALTVDILMQFFRSKRGFTESCLSTAEPRAYHLVDLDWRLEIRIASRALMRQNQVLVTMKLHLHTESKNKNRYLLHDSHPPNVPGEILDEEHRNQKQIVVQTDLTTLTHMIHTLEEALMESRTRRIRNIVKAIG